eukprot:CAMPEP_0119329142 /NCGR_PEP_ID=MMETSP1333-20130426/75161_1 /TAXON_ID=418940 /ORGANISM="Scyphosphaera apsteinii, Strain RCC1455" /LENGTH=633 /DNA_ID=CAMNT_0007338191 /DNA_START=88 /DNA_END=1989 /DNA_ORIENTATION=-
MGAAGSVQFDNPWESTTPPNWSDRLSYKAAVTPSFPSNVGKSLVAPPPPMHPTVRRAFNEAGKVKCVPPVVQQPASSRVLPSPQAPMQQLAAAAKHQLSAALYLIEMLKEDNNRLQRRAKELEQASREQASRIKELEAAVVPKKKRTITRTPQTVPRMHSKAKPAAATIVEESFAGVESAKWIFPELRYSGAYTLVTCGQKENVCEPIAEGIGKFKASPHEYIAIWHQSNMVDWPTDQQRYTLLHRKGTKGFKLSGVSEQGPFKCLVAQYQRLPPLIDLGGSKDRYTDGFSHQGYACAKAALPGRGEGVGDVPSLKILGDADPSDISQGQIGDCWLLSGISSLAEFDGAIARLFRKNENLAAKPSEVGNTYTVTLWDLPSRQEVDVIVDERLARRPDGSGLLGCELSRDGELWVCYLEKAVAAHCGGWDKIEGGQCTHAWALLTGCKEQYTIRRERSSGKYACFGTFNPNTSQWEKLANSPHDGFCGVWPMKWPEVGGGGGLDLKLEIEELFVRMCAWDDANFILAAGTKAGSDRMTDNGIHDGHAYSVLTCLNDVAGTDVDLIKMRNPHGRGEITNGDFDDDGPGWAQYPQIKAEINLTVADDGIFWVTKQEFFRYFETLYLCAKDMAEFLT